MTVYIVTKGMYSDYHIEAVFDSIEAAENHAFNVSRKSEKGRIEKYEVNSTCERLRARWCGIMYKDGHGDVAQDDHEDKPYVRFYAEHRDRYIPHMKGI